YRTNGIEPRLGLRVTGVDTAAGLVHGSDGSTIPFDKLILATGSSPLIPPMPGTDKHNVHVFRTLDDTPALLEKSRPGCKAAVIGGGLLGLEAARGLQVQGCEVTVVHLAGSLMERQLDPTGGAYLARKMENMGIRVLLGRQTRELLGNGRVEGLRFAS